MQSLEDYQLFLFGLKVVLPVGSLWLLHCQLQRVMAEKDAKSYLLHQSSLRWTVTLRVSAGWTVTLRLSQGRLRLANQVEWLGLRVTQSPLTIPVAGNLNLTVPWQSPGLVTVL